MNSFWLTRIRYKLEVVRYILTTKKIDISRLQKRKATQLKSSFDCIKKSYVVN